MKKRRDGILIGFAVVAGLVIGVVFGRDSEDHPDEEVSKEKANESRAVRNDMKMEAVGDRTYRKLVDHARRNGFIPREGGDFLAQAGREEILAMMESLSEAHAATGEWAAKRDVLESIRAAARELCRREGVGAVEWALGKSSSMVVSQMMIAELSRLNPKMGRKFVHKHYRRFGNSAAWDFTNSTLEGAVGRGSADLLETEKEVRITSAPNLHGFADDFDFEGYLSKTESIMMIGSVFQAWAAKDPDAAGEALLAGVGGKKVEGADFFGALKGRAAMVGEDEAADWLLKKMDGLVEEARKVSLVWIAGQDPPVGRTKAFLEKLPDGPERMDFAMRVVSLHRQNGDARQMIAKSFPEEFRTRIAEERVARNGKQADTVLSETMMEDLRIPESDRARLREAMAAGEAE